MHTNAILIGKQASPVPVTRAGALRHIKQLDALRAFAVGSVMVAHYFPTLNRFGEWGAMGVNLFFVISGFLITEILLKCKKEVENGQSIRLTLRQFYARRFLRIFPLYYLVISLSFLFNFSDVRPLRFLGEISYGLYVYHLPVIMIVSSSWLASASISTPLQKAIVWTLLTILVGTLSWYLFERPINRCKRFFPYRLKRDSPDRT